MNRDAAKQELKETALKLLDAMQAERRMTELGPEASAEEAAHVQREAQQLKRAAMRRFKTMCARLAIHAKGGLSGAA